MKKRIIILLNLILLTTVIKVNGKEPGLEFNAPFVCEIGSAKISWLIDAYEHYKDKDNFVFEIESDIKIDYINSIDLNDIKITLPQCSRIIKSLGNNIKIEFFHECISDGGPIRYATNIEASLWINGFHMSDTIPRSIDFQDDDGFIKKDMPSMVVMSPIYDQNGLRKEYIVRFGRDYTNEILIIRDLKHNAKSLDINRYEESDLVVNWNGSEMRLPLKVDAELVLEFEEREIFIKVIEVTDKYVVMAVAADGLGATLVDRF